MPKSTVSDVRSMSVALGKRLQAERRKAGLTQEQLAERLDLSANFIAHLERGSRNMSLSSLAAMAGVFHIPPSELLKEYEGEKEPKMAPAVVALMGAVKRLTPGQARAMLLFLRAS